ncbi:predicted protein [Uncinocarpus reesii 1704]|uniref:Uncharacterized protein n=1 Tax=Uncinocarpus reesii (strain UAMH 1704) TaxID=336963 RepID=C4JW66_UNCRE|nr:uncharacterized protein UREG_06808 [Uncinocarpus reesii 1704]EEP81943.1 predicted protein [Uncinocarpus reesii 1704]
MSGVDAARSSTPSVPPPSYSESTSRPTSRESLRPISSQISNFTSDGPRSRPPSIAPPSYSNLTPSAALHEPAHSISSQISNLTIDRTFINPVTGSSPSEVYPSYQLSHELDAGYGTIEVSRITPFTESSAERRNKHIYSFTQYVFSTTVEIVGKRRSTLRGTIYLRLTHSLLKQSWEISHHNPTTDKTTVLFRTRPVRNLHKEEKLQWEDGRRELVAVESQSSPESPGCKPGLHVVKELGDQMVDVLVTGWCAKIWVGWQMVIAETREKELDSFRRKLAYGGNIFSVRDLNPGSNLWSQ